MVKEQRRGAEKLVDKVREVTDRLVEALDAALRGRPVPAPALAPVRQPTAGEVRRHIRQRRGY